MIEKIAELVRDKKITGIDDKEKAELFRIAKKLGGYNATRFDGGGSSTMWVYDSATGKGGVVNSVSDPKGERSCMNYILLRRK